MHVEQWIVVVSLLSGALFSLAAAVLRVRRRPLALSAGVLFLVACYEIRMDGWEKTVSAPISLDLFAEIPVIVLCLIVGLWQIRFSRNSHVR
jgi:hypothetical protein